MLDSLTDAFPDDAQFRAARHAPASNAFDRRVGYPRWLALLDRNRGARIPLAPVAPPDARGHAEAVVELVPLRRGWLEFEATRLPAPGSPRPRECRRHDCRAGVAAGPAGAASGAADRVLHGTSASSGGCAGRPAGGRQPGVPSAPRLSTRGSRPAHPLAEHGTLRPARREGDRRGVFRAPWDSCSIRSSMRVTARTWMQPCRWRRHSPLDCGSAMRSSTCCSWSSAWSLSPRAVPGVASTACCANWRWRGPAVGRDFAELADAVRAHATSCAACLHVFLKWDEPRAALVRSLHDLGLAQLVLVTGGDSRCSDCGGRAAASR